MPRKSPAPAPDAKPKTKRVRKPAHFVVTMLNAAQPLIIVAPSIKAALKYVAHIKPATATDLLEAGRYKYEVIDTTAPQNEAAVQPPLNGLTATEVAAGDAP